MQFQSIRAPCTLAKELRNSNTLNHFKASMLFCAFMRILRKKNPHINASSDIITDALKFAQNLSAEMAHSYVSENDWRKKNRLFQQLQIGGGLN